MLSTWHVVEADDGVGLVFRCLQVKLLQTEIAMSADLDCRVLHSGRTEERDVQTALAVLRAAWLSTAVLVYVACLYQVSSHTRLISRGGRRVTFGLSDSGPEKAPQ